VIPDDAVNVILPLDAVPGLSVPPLAITDGSADPIWVELPCRGRYLYGRRRTIRLPLDAATAEVARRWVRFERRQRTVLTPIHIGLVCTGLATWHVSGDIGREWLVLSFLLAGVTLQLWIGYLEKKLTFAQRPELIGGVVVYLPAMSDRVAREWERRNPTARVVYVRPRWRRYPARVYRWAFAASVVAGAGIWWFALRDGVFGAIAVLAFLALLGSAAVLGFMALPLGFIRFDDTPDPR
jgi:hypothetical protein